MILLFCCLSRYYNNSTVVFWQTIGAPSSRYDRLLLGEHIGKDIFSPLSELESLVSIQDQRLYERLGLLATRLPDKARHGFLDIFAESSRLYLRNCSSTSKYAG
jgi:hypothetical protein